MNLNSFTEKAQEALVATPRLAASLSHVHAEPEHLLVTLAEQSGGVVPALLQKLGHAPATVALAMREQLKRQPTAHGGSEPGISPRLQPGAGAGAGRSDRHAGSVRQHRAPVPGHRQRGQAVAGRRAAARAGHHPRGGDRGARRGARVASRHRSEPRGQVPGARALRPRPDHPRRARQARPGRRPRRGGAPGHPGAGPPHQEQPGAHRRAGRRQDRDRRRPGPADHPRRRARRAEGQAHRRPRHGRAHRRRQVSRRVRGAAEGGAEGDRRRPGPDRPVHRRAAHRGRGRRVGGLARRLEHAQADARPRRAAHHRRHHPRRVPQAHREGRRRSSAASSR